MPMKQAAWLFVAASTMLTACGERRSTTIGVPRSAEGAMLGIATLPGRYYSDESEPASPRYNYLKLRTYQRDGRNEVLIRPYMQNVGFIGDVYAVSTDGTFTSRRAPLEAWESGDEAESRDFMNAGEDLVGGELPLLFRGKRFPASGLNDVKAFGSATGKYLASWSTTVKVASGGIIAPLAFGRGETYLVYVEIFDVSTGRLLLSASSNELGSVPSGAWLGDRFFVLSYSGGDRAGDLHWPTHFCFLAIMPGK